MAKVSTFIGRGLAAACCLSIWSVAGCAGAGSGVVEGTVTFQGRKPASGTVLFVGEKGVIATGEITPEGSYFVVDVPAGPMKVAVSSPDPRVVVESNGRNIAKQGKAKAAPAGPTNWFPLPPKYADPDNSGLSFKVSPGKNKYDITLE